MDSTQPLFTHEDFTACLSLARLARQRFVRCRFAGLDLRETAIEGCTFEDCDFSFADFGGQTVLRSAFLGCDFSNALLFSTTFTDCKMTGSAFDGARLQRHGHRTEATGPTQVFLASPSKSRICGASALQPPTCLAAPSSTATCARPASPVHR